MTLFEMTFVLLRCLVAPAPKKTWEWFPRDWLSEPKHVLQYRHRNRRYHIQVDLWTYMIIKKMRYLIIYLKSYCGRHGSFVSIIFDCLPFRPACRPGNFGQLGESVGQAWLCATTWRLTWNIIMEVWKIIFRSKWVICRFHINLPGCISKIQVKWFLHMDGEKAQARPVRWSTRRKQAKDMSCFASWHKKTKDLKITHTHTGTISYKTVRN